MKMFAHVALDGSIDGLVVAPDGTIGAGLVSSPGVQVCEILGHDFDGNGLELEKMEKLERLLQSHTVDVRPAQGKLVRRKKQPT